MGYTEVFPIRGEQGRAKYARENRKLLAERILVLVHVLEPHALLVGCLLYTSDAADEL